MNALRQFVTPNNGILSISLPIEFQTQTVEIIILPVNETISTKTAEQIAKSHRIIDEGGGISNANEFLAEFQQSRQDRSLPFRD